MTTSSSSKTLNQFVSSYSKMREDREDSSSHLILFQHESFALLKQRQAAVSDVADSSIYERARIRTPSENAHRDVNGGPAWLLHVATEFSKQRRSTSNTTGKRGVWVQTTFSTMCPDSFHMIDAVSNPFGWDNENIMQQDRDETGVTSVSLESLEELACSVENAVAAIVRDLSKDDDGSSGVVVVIESISPILMRHGFEATLAWLHRLYSKNGPVLVAIHSELLTTRQIMALQDECSACFLLENGAMTLIRQGAREKGNVLRLQLPFELVVKKKVPTVSEVSLILTEDKGSHIPGGSQMESDTSHEQSIETDVASKPSVSEVVSQQRSGKVVLKHQDDNGRRDQSTNNATPSPQPKIYLQDDDPEFDDLDEEDPDDDLDI